MSRTFLITESARSWGHSFTEAAKDGSQPFILLSLCFIPKCANCRYSYQIFLPLKHSTHSTFLLKLTFQLCIGFVLSLSPIIAFLSFLVFLYLFVVCFFPPLFFVLGARSLAGGRRVYGRSGREPFYYIYIYISPYFLCC